MANRLRKSVWQRWMAKCHDYILARCYQSLVESFAARITLIELHPETARPLKQRMNVYFEQGNERQCEISGATGEMRIAPPGTVMLAMFQRIRRIEAERGVCVILLHRWDSNDDLDGKMSSILLYKGYYSAFPNE